jgi:beta-galactosidase
VEALDEEGYLCPLANNKVHIKINGTGQIAGVGNGNPQSFAPFQAKYVYLFNGQAMIIVRADDAPGKIKVEAFTENLTPANVTISVK